MSVLSSAEFLLWAGLGFLFWKKGLGTRFPAMAGYLALHVIATPFLLLLLYLQTLPSGNRYFVPYFISYYLVYIASSVFLFFICIEVFRSALSAFPGLMKIGIVIFRWAILVSVIVTFSSITYMHSGIRIIPSIADGLMRSVSVLELCLLAFLCLSMNALKLAVRDIAFGIALGFGVLSANDFIMSALWNPHIALSAPIQIVNEAIVLLAIGVWIAYCALPEKARKPVILAPNSTIYRWNEIAAALGHGTKVAVPQPANSFFLSDVEKVVDKVLTRSNLQSNESK